VESNVPSPFFMTECQVLRTEGESDVPFHWQVLSQSLVLIPQFCNVCYLAEAVAICPDEDGRFVTLARITAITSTRADI